MPARTARCRCAAVQCASKCLECNTVTEWHCVVMDVQDPPGVSNFQETFTNNQVYHGGFVAQSVSGHTHGMILCSTKN